MKIKHFQGYGSVIAVKKALKRGLGDYGDMTRLEVEVRGNHEYGLLTSTAQDAFNWLVKHFDKQATSSSSITCDFCYDNYFVNENGNSVEVCEYVLKYKTNNAL